MIILRKPGAQGSSDHGGLTGLIDDDHPQYMPVDGSRGFTSTVSGSVPVQDYHLSTKGYVDTQVASVSGSSGSESFIGLTDTPSEYSNGRYLVSTSSGIDFTDAIPESTGNGFKTGRESLLEDSNSVSVVFTDPFVSSDYIVTTEIENTTDPTPSIYPTLVTNKTTSGFDVNFSGDIDSSNYYLNWMATLSGIGLNVTLSGTYYYNVDLSEDTSPELSGDLQMGSYGMVLDTTPSGNFIHGYTIGYSGEISTMTVDLNDNGVGTPFYMKSNGNWAQCTAASGTTQMPCASIAVEEGEGTRKIMWKGLLRKGDWSWTPGSLLYVSTVEAAITSTEPTGGAWSQCIGLAISADTIRFDPGFYTGYITS